MTGRVRIPRVERRCQRTDGAQVRRSRFRFRCPETSHQIVEGRRQRVELPARAGQRQRPPEVARGRHRRNLARHVVDGLGQHPRQPEAADRRQDKAAEGDRGEGHKRIAASPDVAARAYLAVRERAPHTLVAARAAASIDVSV